MLRISNLKLGIDEDISILKKLIIKKLKIKENDLIKYHIFKESIDARKRGRIDFVYTVDVELKNEEKILNACLDAEDVNSKENVDKVNTELETLKNIIDPNKTYEVEFDYEFDILRVVFITENS